MPVFMMSSEDTAKLICCLNCNIDVIFIGPSSKLLSVYVICHGSHPLPVLVLRFGQSPPISVIGIWSTLQKVISHSCAGPCQVLLFHVGQV